MMWSMMEILWIAANVVLLTAVAVILRVILPGSRAAGHKGDRFTGPGSEGESRRRTSYEKADPG